MKYLAEFDRQAVYEYMERLFGEAEQNETL